MRESEEKKLMEGGKENERKRGKEIDGGGRMREKR
jgi:hypothetical protein